MSKIGQYVFEQQEAEDRAGFISLPRPMIRLLQAELREQREATERMQSREQSREDSKLPF